MRQSRAAAGYSRERIQGPGSPQLSLRERLRASGCRCREWSFTAPTLVDLLQHCPGGRIVAPDSDMPRHGFFRAGLRRGLGPHRARQPFFKNVQQFVNKRRFKKELRRICPRPSRVILTVGHPVVQCLAQKAPIIPDFLRRELPPIGQRSHRMLRHAQLRGGLPQREDIPELWAVAGDCFRCRHRRPSCRDHPP